MIFESTDPSGSSTTSSTLPNRQHHRAAILLQQQEDLDGGLQGRPPPPSIDDHAYYHAGQSGRHALDERGGVNDHNFYPMENDSLVGNQRMVSMSGRALILAN